MAALGCCSATHTLCRWVGVACALRSTSAVTTHLRLAREVRACLHCVRLILPLDEYYSCGVCEERHDLCARCYGADRELGGARGERSSRAAMAHHPLHLERRPYARSRLWDWPAASKRTAGQRSTYLPTHYQCAPSVARPTYLPVTQGRGPVDKFNELRTRPEGLAPRPPKAARSGAVLLQLCRLRSCGRRDRRTGRR